MESVETANDTVSRPGASQKTTVPHRRQRPRAALCSDTAASSQAMAASPPTARSSRRTADAAQGPPVAFRHSWQWQTMMSRTGPSIVYSTAPHGHAPALTTRASPRAARDPRRRSTSRTRPSRDPFRESRGRGHPRGRERRRALRDSLTGRNATSVDRFSGTITSTSVLSFLRQRSATAAACSNAHSGRPSSAVSKPASDGPGSQLRSKRTAPGRGRNVPSRSLSIFEK